MQMRMNLDEPATQAAIDVRNGIGQEINVGTVTNLLIRLGAALFHMDEPEADKIVAELRALGADVVLIDGPQQSPDEPHELDPERSDPIMTEGPRADPNPDD